MGIRTGDTPQRERAAMLRNPPDILVTTPESLYLMLTSQAREMLSGVEAVIVDEIHAVAHSKRGSHLALTLERLEGGGCGRRSAARPGVQRIGLSATQNPLEEIGRFLVGPSARSRSSTLARVSSSTCASRSLSSRWPNPGNVPLDAASAERPRTIRSHLPSRCPVARAHATRSGRRSTPSC